MGGRSRRLCPQELKEKEGRVDTEEVLEGKGKKTIHLARSNRESLSVPKKVIKKGGGVRKAYRVLEQTEKKNTR